MTVKIPLIVGVTGHRDLINEETEAIKLKVATFLRDLQGSFNDLEINVLSPLAEGADQLVAEVAEELGIPIVALLPMPRMDYRSDFNELSGEKFDHLIEISSDIVELPLVPGNYRDDQYVELAGYLAAHSHILLALWDGEETYVPGGTSAVVRFHQHETMSAIDVSQPLNPIDFIEDESDLVHHIICSRQSSAEKADKVDSCWLTRDDVTPRTDEMPKRYHTVFNRMATFNRDANLLNTGEVVPLLNQQEKKVSSPQTKKIETLFGVADQLATHYQRLMMRTLQLGHLLVLSAGFSFIIYADLYNHEYMVYLYLVSMMLVLALFRLEANRQWQMKHLEYRALAEALRVQFYWTIAGVRHTKPHHFSHDSFFERRDMEIGWIRNAMRYAGIESDATLVDRPDPEIDAVIESWIRDDHLGQCHYYERKAIERSQRNKITARLETLSMGLVLVIGFLLVISPGTWDISTFLIALTGMLPFVVAVRQNYAHRTSERELAGQYQYFYRIFSSADELLKRTSQPEVRREILRALGVAALDESSQWIIRQRERPVGTGVPFG